MNRIGFDFTIACYIDETMIDEDIFTQVESVRNELNHALETKLERMLIESKYGTIELGIGCGVEFVFEEPPIKS